MVSLRPELRPSGSAEPLAEVSRLLTAALVGEVGHRSEEHPGLEEIFDDRCNYLS
jgi:hypothetical protein